MRYQNLFQNKVQNCSDTMLNTESRKDGVGCILIEKKRNAAYFSEGSIPRGKNFLTLVNSNLQLLEKYLTQIGDL